VCARVSVSRINECKKNVMLTLAAILELPDAGVDVSRPERGGGRLMRMLRPDWPKEDLVMDVTAMEDGVLVRGLVDGKAEEAIVVKAYDERHRGDLVAATFPLLLTSSSLFALAKETLLTSNISFILTKRLEKLPLFRRGWRC